MKISFKTEKGKSINLDIEDSSETIDIKIHGDSVHQVVPGPEAAMRIFVSTLKGKTFNLEVNGSDTIGKVKAMIHDQGGPPVDKLNLNFHGRMLENSRTLADYNIKQNSNLVIISRGCIC